jgi:hypothetical protein
MNFKDFLFGLFIGIVILVGYLRHETHYIRQNGQTYQHAGMAEIQPGIFAPVYRRTQCNSK